MRLRPPSLDRLQSADHANAISLLTLGALGDFELHLLTFFEQTEAARLDRAVVDEDVVARALNRDEAVALLGIEPFDGSLRHLFSLHTFCSRTSRPRAVPAAVRLEQERVVQRHCNLSLQTTVPTLPQTSPICKFAVRKCQSDMVAWRA